MTETDLKGSFVVTLVSKILIYDSKLRLWSLRKPKNSTFNSTSTCVKEYRSYLSFFL